MTNRVSRWMLLCVVALGMTAVSVAPAWAEDTGGGDPAPTPDAPKQITAPQQQQQQPVTDAPTTDEPTTQPGPQSKPRKQNPLFVPLLIGGMIVLWIFMGRKPRQAEKKRKEMLANLKKGDKVTSIGGIVGTVLEVREHDVTVKVDEGSNTRMKFARWAIRGVGGAEEDEQTR